MKTAYLKHPGLLTFFYLLLSSCGVPTESQQEVKTAGSAVNEVTLSEAQFRIAGIQYGKIEMRTISGVIQASGKLDVPPQSKVSISAPMGGVVKETELLQGMRINKGEAVAVMQNSDYIQLQQDYLETAGQIEFLRAEYERQEILAKENVNAKKTLQKAKADYISTKAKLDGLRAKLHLINIDVPALESGQIQNSVTLYAPITGYVTKVNVNIGSFVNANEVLVEIVNTEHLHAELTVFEKDVPNLKSGQKVLFTLANESQYRLATVYLIGKEIAPDRTIQVHCHLDKEDKNLIPGMYLKAVVETDSAHVTALPDAAIVQSEGKKFIFVDAGKHQKTGESAFRMVEIATGESELGYTEVVLPPDVNPSLRVVIKGAYSLLSQVKNVED
jgi:cobalt-zinc-cadmium efflux system membrane fusion protein